ncbi:hypothetical protein C8D94_10171 [Marinirhabdus gelatinilytica]|uniref:Uncharacterized protein n=1 Tax=Marinirhabdus gelatinilytica TaxID=1703343 RepID=A0A370QIN1_9FLAO|nr:hypothetical protein C8D94_10171 [Marinirhabdus gelatinilytica]
MFYFQKLKITKYYSQYLEKQSVVPIIQLTKFIATTQRYRTFK